MDSSRELPKHTLAACIGVEAVENSLYLYSYHSTKINNLSYILENGNIKSKNSKKNIIFFFYGKPSYTLKKGGNDINELSFACNKNILTELSAVYPFDSGGFLSGRYLGDIKKRYGRVNNFRTLLKYFKINPNKKAIASFVKSIFGSNRAYLSGKFRSDISLRDFDVLKLICSIYRRAQSEQYLDPPANTIEIQRTSPVLLDEDSFTHIIVSTSDLARYEVQELIKRYSLFYETYDEECRVSKETLWRALSEIAEDISKDVLISEKSQ